MGPSDASGSGGALEREEAVLEAGVDLDPLVAERARLLVLAVIHGHPRREPDSVDLLGIAVDELLPEARLLRVPEMLDPFGDGPGSRVQPEGVVEPGILLVPALEHLQGPAAAVLGTEPAAVHPVEPGRGDDPEIRHAV